MQPTPAISVVLPYFNAEKTLAKAIESTLNQTFSDFELILVDNNSNDLSKTIAKGFQSKDPRIKLAHEKRQGVAFASNLGFEMASGAYLTRMDADDRMLPPRLERQSRYLNTNPQVGLVGGRVQYCGKKENLGFRHYVDWSNRLTQVEAISLNRFVELPIVNPTIMFRKTIFQQYGGYHDGDFPEDYEMILRWLDQGVQMGKVQQQILEWHDHEERLTRSDKKYSEDKFYKLKAQYLSKWLKQESKYEQVWVWGAGKLSRRRSNFLLDHGIEIKGYIDVKIKELNLPCIDFHDLPAPGQMFILSYVSNRGKREEIKQYLLHKGYKEGVDFLLAA